MTDSPLPDPITEEKLAESAGATTARLLREKDEEIERLTKWADTEIVSTRASEARMLRRLEDAQIELAHERERADTAVRERERLGEECLRLGKRVAYLEAEIERWRRKRG